MGLKLCALASGSSGNCIFVGSDSTNILIDAGLSCRETLRRLEEVGVDASTIRAICLTHEHSDHRSGLVALQRKMGVPLYVNTGTLEAIEQDGQCAGLPWNVFATGSAFEIGNLLIEPFSVPHDSYEPVGFVVSADGARAGIVTDMGVATGVVRQRLKDCHMVVIEANHDEDLLKEADRPWSLKQRIRGRQGHLSNAQAGELIAGIAGPNLHAVFLAHLSSDCNTPALALKTVREALVRSDHGHVEVRLTYRDRVSEMVAALVVGQGRAEYERN